MTTKTKLIISLVLLVLGVSCRLLPHAWNFAPIAAITLFAGTYLGRRYAVVLPLVTMAIGDIFLGFYGWQLMVAVYGSFVLIGLMASWVKKYKSVETVVAGSILASVIFFLVTNFTVWQFSSWYEKSLAGLFQCYLLALPFFRNTLMGDIFYVAVLFGAYETAVFFAKSRRLSLLSANK